MNDFFNFVDDTRVKYREGLINRTEAMVSIFGSISSLMAKHALDLIRTVDQEKTNGEKIDRIVKIIED